MALHRGTFGLGWGHLGLSWPLYGPLWPLGAHFCSLLEVYGGVFAAAPLLREVSHHGVSSHRDIQLPGGCHGAAGVSLSPFDAVNSAVSCSTPAPWVNIPVDCPLPALVSILPILPPPTAPYLPIAVASLVHGPICGNLLFHRYRIWKSGSSQKRRKVPSFKKISLGSQLVNFFVENWFFRVSVTHRFRNCNRITDFCP